MSGATSIGPSELGHDFRERPRRVAEVLDDDDVARADNFARQRAGKRETRPARDREQANCRDQLAFVGDRFQDGRARRRALLGGGGAEDLEQLGRIGLARHLTREKRSGSPCRARDRRSESAFRRRSHDIPSRRLAVFVTSEHDVARDAVGGRGDERVEQRLGG